MDTAKNFGKFGYNFLEIVSHFCLSILTNILKIFILNLYTHLLPQRSKFRKFNDTLFIP